MNIVIGWICVYTAIVFGASVWFGLDIGVKEGMVFFITVEIILTLFTFGTYLMYIGG